MLQILYIETFPNNDYFSLNQLVDFGTFHDLGSADMWSRNQWTASLIP